MRLTLSSSSFVASNRVSFVPMMMSSKAEPLAASVCTQTSRILSSVPFGEMNSLRFMSAETPWMAIS